MIICNRAVCETVELCKPGNIIPYFFIIGVENMRTIFMHMNPLYILCKHISGNIRAFIDHQN